MRFAREATEAPSWRVIRDSASLRMAAAWSCFVKRLAPMQPQRGVGGLELLPLRRRVRREVARGGNEEVMAVLHASPCLVLAHGGFHHLVGVEAGVLAHDSIRERANGYRHALVSSPPRALTNCCTSAGSTSEACSQPMRSNSSNALLM